MKINLRKPTFFMGLISKGHKVNKKIEFYVTIVAVISFLILIVNTILTLAIYFYHLLFSSFKPCYEPKLNDYVKNQSVCEKLYGRDPRF